MLDAKVKYDNFMMALMDSAQISDYWPASLLPIPYIQAALWNAFDYQPVTLRYVPDEKAEVPPNHTDYVQMPSRGEDALYGPHVEELYVYRVGLEDGQNSVVVWYRCGYGQPQWMVIELA